MKVRLFIQAWNISSRFTHVFFFFMRIFRDLQIFDNLSLVNVEIDLYACF